MSNFIWKMVIQSTEIVFTNWSRWRLFKISFENTEFKEKNISKGNTIIEWYNIRNIFVSSVPFLFYLCFTLNYMYSLGLDRSELR